MKNFPGIDKSRAYSTAATNACTEISKIGITALGITAGIIGCWAVASIIVGAVNSSGPINLIAHLFTAING
ncbi:MAG: hypothetical protein PHZ02_06410 [Desulfocapsaceae bacterium]|nr:hypothetical protein [Desulfocapsaceae bacterium]